MTRSAGLCAVAWFSTSSLLVSAAGAQIRSPGDLDPQGRVFTKIQVIIAAPEEYGSPVSGLTFLVVTEGGQRISVRTDDAGIATAWLPRTTYRLVTPEPVVWKGQAYTWDVLVSVKPGMGVVRLSAGNATAVTAVGPSLAKASERASHRSDGRVREGFWFNAGLGYGSLTCSGCDGYFGGLSLPSRSSLGC